MPMFGLRNLVKSAIGKIPNPDGNAESASQTSSCDDTGSGRPPFGDSMPRRHDLPDELKWLDKEPLRTGPLEYTRLGADEMRLVYLYPGATSDDINLSTEVCRIDDANEDYVALSYVWGDSGVTSPIYVNRHEVQATCNLVSALRHIRGMMREDEVCVLWIDAICINQADIEERNSQVTKMRQIYEQTAAVAAWLGEEDGLGLQYLRELGEWHYGRDENPISQERKRERIEAAKHVKDRYQEMRSAASIVANKYWQRVWTVQEYSSPQAGVFLCGDVWMDRVMLSGALTMYIQALRSLQAVIERQGHQGSFADISITAVERLRHRELISFLRSSDKHTQTGGMDRFNFFDMLLKFRDLRSTDPRDKIYAPLNLSPDGASLAHTIQVDYSLTIPELYISVARHCLSLKDWPLCILENCRLGAADDLPSWVPDWRSLPRYILSRDRTTGKQVVSASKGVFQQSPMLPPTVLPGNYLQLQGIQIDVLTQVWQPWFSLELKDLIEISVEVDDPLSTYPGSGISLAEAARTLINPNEPLDEPVELSQLVLARREQWRRNGNMIARVNRRRLARTSNGFVGLAPAEAEAGDELWLLRGGNVFYVLRSSSSGRHVLVGEAILHGMMHGELAHLTEISESLPAPTIVEIE